MPFTRWPLTPAKPIPTAGELNRAISELRRQGMLYVAPPLKAVYYGGGWLLRISGGQSGNAVLSNLVAILGQSNGSVYAWQSASLQNGVFVSDGISSSDVETDPAFELNSQAGIPPGTVVFMARIETLAGGLHWIFSHPQHARTAPVVTEIGTGTENASRIFNFGIYRPGWYWSPEPAAPFYPSSPPGPNFCDFFDTTKTVTLPSPFNSVTGIPGNDGIYSIAATGTGDAFALAGGVENLTFLSDDIQDGAAAANVLTAILNGLSSAVGQTFPLSNGDSTNFLTASGGPLGTAPVTITAHANPFVKGLMNALAITGPVVGTLDPTATYTIVQPATFDFTINGFQNSRASLSIPGVTGTPFNMQIGSFQNGFINLTSYNSFNYTGGPGIDSTWWMFDPFTYQLIGQTTGGSGGGSTYMLGTLNPDSPIQGVLPNILRCWPFHAEWDSFEMIQTAGPNTDPASIGPLTATVDGIYY